MTSEKGDNVIMTYVRQEWWRSQDEVNCEECNYKECVFTLGCFVKKLVRQYISKIQVFSTLIFKSLTVYTMNSVT